MKELTAHQKEIWDLYRPTIDGGLGKSAEDVAREFGVTEKTVRKAIGVIRVKLGIDKRKGDEARLTESREPEKVAEMVVGLMDPFASIEEAIARSGLPVGTGHSILRRLRTRFKPVMDAGKELATNELIKMLNDKIRLTLTYYDEKVVSEASARDLAMATGIMIEKRQLLRGEPTQILSDHARKELNELLPLAIAEAQRRGLTIPVVVDGTAERVS